MTVPIPGRGTMNRALLALLVAGCSVLAPAPTRAQSPATFYAPTSADPAIPSPESVLGYALGSRYTPHHRVVDYLEQLAAASNRIELIRYGTTYEDRPLLLLVISDPSNLARTEDLKKTYARLADPRQTSEGAARDLSRDLPVAVWLSYNVHGNETSATEAAMATAYHLAGARDKATLDLLRQSVVLLDPCLNPDGRDRYVNWFRGVRGRLADPRPGSREHDEPWPGGRYNHYLFDLNRDWAWLTQRETRSRVELYRQWKPQVHVDFHEMWFDATYFFFPPERPIHPHYPPSVAKWGRMFGEGNAAAFDAKGWRYYTAESFDLYYPGYGDSWPTFHGAVGMTYEQAGHSSAGATIARTDGDTLTLGDRTEHHFVASLATVRTAVTHREARLMDFHRFFEADRNPSPRAYLIPPGNDPPRTAELIELLMAHGAEVQRSKGEVRAQGLRGYDGERSSAPLPAGTYVISMRQPLHRFLNTILEPEAGLPDTLFYDLSAWSLPLAFGVEAYTSDGDVSADLEMLAEPPTLTGTVQNRDAGYAYLISWDRNGAAKAATRLLRDGVRVHFTTREVTVRETTFPPGSLIIFRDGNPEHLPRLLEEVAFVTAVDVLGVDSGLTDAGPDLGSSRVVRLREPKVGLIGDSPASPTSVGACWFLLDQGYQVPHSILTVDQLTERNLDDLSVLVFPDAWGGGRAYQGAIDSSTVALLRAWVRRGGVFVGLGGGALFAARSGLSSVEIASPLEETSDSDDEEAFEARKRLRTFKERERLDRLATLPGTIFRVRVDPLHPLGFGYDGEAWVLKTSNEALELGPEGSNVAWFAASPRMSGYASEASVDRLVDRPFLVDERLGRGHVVLYVEDPNFRLFWYGLTRMFLNSLFFLPSLSG